MDIISPFLTFPSIGWWLRIANAGSVLFEKQEHYQKMSDRNRYRISGANNSILLSIPLQNGRNQHIPMAEVKIKNENQWQVQHWRTLTSVYNRSPYFFHYEATLKALYDQQFTYLIDFNRAAMQWVKQQLQFNFEVLETVAYQKEYPDNCEDLRHQKYTDYKFPAYYQVFGDRIGFIHGLSILDLLFSEGPGTGSLLRANQFAGVIKG